MGLQRAFIRDGDTTTAGGTVHARPQQWPVTYGSDAKHACYEGDPVQCPACKSTGVTRCVPPFRINTGPDGRQANLDGDLCLCKCPAPPRLIAQLHDIWMGFEAYEIAAMPGSGGWLAYAGYALAGDGDRARPYDEQTRLDAEGVEGVEGVPYRIEVGDGRVLSGKVGSNGLLPRVETIGETGYTVYWGDEALAKMDGADA